MENTVTRRGQVTIPVELRRKYRTKEGMKIEVLDSNKGLLWRPIPRMLDLAGIDAGKYTYTEVVRN